MIKHKHIIVFIKKCILLGFCYFIAFDGVIALRNLNNNNDSYTQN